MEQRISSARSVRDSIRRREARGDHRDPSHEIDRIDAALGGLPADDVPAANECRAELMVEKALLLERAGRASDVERLLDEMVDRFESVPDHHAARAAAWALRNRIHARLEADRVEEALLDAERLRALWGRAAITEDLAAVWKLLMLRGHEAAATRLIAETLDAERRMVSDDDPGPR